jgi:16S rRNA (uracil1498-N3)-methyltransferase
MTRLYVADRALAVGAQIALSDAPLAHLRARRAREGEAVTLFDGSGADFLGELVRLDRRDALVHLSQRVEGLGFGEPTLTIALSVIAADRMDWAIQKTAELGVARIIPILAERSQAPGNAANKVAHWQAVAASAAEQCGRARVAQVRAPLRLIDALKLLKSAQTAPQVWVCERDEIAIQPTRGAGEGGNAVFIGPEGGWSETEHASFVQEKARVLCLSRATLRTETAAITAAAMLLTTP